LEALGMMVVVERAIHLSFCSKSQHLLLFTVAVSVVLMPKNSWDD
jgi:hypothetical protein